MVAISLFSSVRYIWWRASGTLVHVFRDPLNNLVFDDVMMLLLLGAELFALAILVLGYFQTIRPLRRQPSPLPDSISEWPTIDVFIPTYNEPLQIVRHTVMAARHMDWPPECIRVHVLDDGRREEFRDFCAEYSVSYITRPDNLHAKAGNLNHALTQTFGEFVAIFDCDHVPVRSFLQISMGSFAADDKLALVQTPHHFYSPDPFERNLKQFRSVPNESELFYGLVQDGSDFWNAAFFCGSCAVIRRQALTEIGGIAVETVTEDAHTSLRLQAKGWNTAYINIPQAAGLATESLTGHIGQRVRWARGMVQILRVDCPLFKRGLKLEQRLCYLNSILYFLNALPRLIFLTSPLVYLLCGRLNIYGDSLSVLAYALPHLVLTSITNSRIQGRYRFSFWNEIYEAVLAPYILLPTWLALINPKLGKFNVTSKGGKVANAYFDFSTARPFLVLLGLNLLGAVLAVPRLLWWNANHKATVLVNLAWTLYNLAVLSVSAASAWEQFQRRSSVRIPLCVPGRLRLHSGAEFDCETNDLSIGGAALTAAGLDHGIEKQPAALLFRHKETDWQFQGTLSSSISSGLRFHSTHCRCSPKRDWL